MDTYYTPYYIEDAIKRRKKAAEQWFRNDQIISEFCEKNGIDLEYTNGNLGSIYEPDMAAEKTLLEIERQLKMKKIENKK